MYKFIIIFNIFCIAIAFQVNYVVAGDKDLPSEGTIRAGTKRSFAFEEDGEFKEAEEAEEVCEHPRPQRPVIKRPALGIRFVNEPLPNNLDLIKRGREKFLFLNYFQTKYHGRIVGLILRRCENDAYGRFLPDVLGGIGLLTPDFAIASNPLRYIPERIEASSRITIELKCIISTLEMIDIPDLELEESYRGYNPDAIRELRQGNSEIQKIVGYCPALTPFFSIYNELKRVSMLLNRLHDYKI